MKKFIYLFILAIIILPGFNTANAQLEFYEFAFNIYDNGERIADTSKFQIFYRARDRESDEPIYFPELKPSKDTSETYGFDYHFSGAGSMLRDYIVYIYISRIEDGPSTGVLKTMQIKIDCKKSSAWSMLVMDKVEYKHGQFLITESEWPDNRRDRPMDNRYFPFLDENFDWEKIRAK